MTTTEQARRLGPVEIYDALKHGDDTHKRWLRDALDALFADQPVPPPYPPSEALAKEEATEPVPLQGNPRASTGTDISEENKQRGDVPAPKPVAEVTADAAGDPVACQVATEIFTYLTTTKRPLLAKIAGMVAAYRPEVAEPNDVITELHSGYAEGGARLAKALDAAAALIERLSSRCEALELQIEEANIGRDSLRAELRDVQRNYAVAEARCAALEDKLREYAITRWGCDICSGQEGQSRSGWVIKHEPSCILAQPPERPAATAEEK